MLKKIPNNNQTRNKIYISKKCHAPGLKDSAQKKLSDFNKWKSRSLNIPIKISPRTSLEI